jgi:GNAT superfamily N-acetyltransferase
MQRPSKQLTGIPATASGAHIDDVDPGVAAAFLARLGERGPEPIATALGAFEDDGTLIGLAVFGTSTRERAWATVAVMPARRRLQVGTDLLGALLRQSATQGIRYLVCSHPVVAPAGDLVRSMGLTAARHVHQGMTTLVIIVSGL